MQEEKSVTKIHINGLYEPSSPQETEAKQVHRKTWNATQIYTNNLYVPSPLDFDAHPVGLHLDLGINNSRSQDSVSEPAKTEPLSRVSGLSIQPQIHSKPPLPFRKANKVRWHCLS